MWQTNIDLIDKEKPNYIEKFSKLMVYLSLNHGVFEIIKITSIHDFSGQSFMDGANMNTDGLTIQVLLEQMLSLNQHKHCHSSW